MAIGENLRGAFAEILGIDAATIKDDMTLFDMGGDSLDSVEILMEAESKLNIEIDDDAWDQCSTFADYLKLVTP